MKIEGSYPIPAPRDAVWQRLFNPDSLARTLPGCEKLEPNGDGSFRGSLKVGIAAIKGTYAGRLQILDAVPPERYRLKMEGQGKKGFIKGEALVTLADNAGATIVTYSGEAQVGGLMASVGQRLIQGAVKQNLKQFFDSLAKQFTPDSPARPSEPGSPS